MISRLAARGGLLLAALLLLVPAPAMSQSSGTGEISSATPDERARVRTFLGQWLAAWRAQDLEAYLAHYAADARVDSRDRAAHEEHKRRLFARGDRPVIDVGDVEIDAVDDDGVRLLRVRFDQSYQSPLVTDFGRKEMLLRDLGRDLLIARETWRVEKGSIEVPLGAEAAPAPPEPPHAEPLELPPGDELLAAEPLLPPPPPSMGLPGLPALQLEDGRAIVEEIVARVNGRVLTRSMYLDRIGWYQETLLNDDPPDLEERLKSLAAETLDTTIDRWVLIDEAKHGYDFERYWREWVTQFRKQIGAADMAELDQLLAEQGTSVEALKEQVIETEIPNMYLQQEIAGRLTFSEAELQAHFEANRARYQPPLTVTFRQILVPVAAGQDPSKSEAIARHVIDELASGREWCELQSVYGQSGMPCVDYEDMALTDLLPELRESAAGLPLGATSKPIRSTQGYHVLRVTRRVGAEPVTFEAVRERVLIDVRSAAFERELAKVVEDLRSSAQVEVNPRYALPDESGTSLTLPATSVLHEEGEGSGGGAP